MVKCPGPLRQIFKDVCRATDNDTAQSVSFAEMEKCITSGYVLAGDFVVKTVAVAVAEAEAEVVAWR